MQADRETIAELVAKGVRALEEVRALAALEHGVSPEDLVIGWEGMLEGTMGHMERLMAAWTGGDRLLTCRCLIDMAAYLQAVAGDVRVWEIEGEDQEQFRAWLERHREQVARGEP